MTPAARTVLHARAPAGAGCAFPFSRYRATACGATRLLLCLRTPFAHLRVRWRAACRHPAPDEDGRRSCARFAKTRCAATY